MKITPARLADWRIEPSSAAPPMTFARLLDADARRRRRRRARLAGVGAVAALALTLGIAAGYGHGRETDDARRARLFEAHVQMLAGAGGAS